MFRRSEDAGGRGGAVSSLVLCVTKKFESNAIPSQIGRTDSVRTVGRRDSGRRAYTDVFTACSGRICLPDPALVATAATSETGYQPNPPPIGPHIPQSIDAASFISAVF